MSEMDDGSEFLINEAVTSSRNEKLSSSIEKQWRPQDENYRRLFTEYRMRYTDAVIGLTDTVVSGSETDKRHESLSKVYHTVKSWRIDDTFDEISAIEATLTEVGRYGHSGSQYDLLVDREYEIDGDPVPGLTDNRNTFGINSLHYSGYPLIPTDIPKNNNELQTVTVHPPDIDAFHYYFNPQAPKDSQEIERIPFTYDTVHDNAYWAFVGESAEDVIKQPDFWETFQTALAADAATPESEVESNRGNIREFETIRAGMEQGAELDNLLKDLAYGLPRDASAEFPRLSLEVIMNPTISQIGRAGAVWNAGRHVPLTDIGDLNHRFQWVAQHGAALQQAIYEHMALHPENRAKHTEAILTDIYEKLNALKLLQAC